MDPRFPTESRQRTGVFSCSPPTVLAGNGVERAARRCTSGRTPRGMLLVVAAVASLGLTLPTADGAGAGLCSAAPVGARGREPESAPEKRIASNGGSSRRGDLFRSRGVEEHDHDDTASARASSRSRDYTTRGEEIEEHAGVNGGRRGRREKDSLQGRGVGAAAAAGAPDAMRDTFGSSSLGRLDSDEADEDEGSSWDGSTHSDYSNSYEDYDTEEDDWEEGTSEEDGVGAAEARPSESGHGDSDDPDNSEGSSEDGSEENFYDSYDDDEDASMSSSTDFRRQQGHETERGSGHGDEESNDNSVEVCVVTWNLAEASPPPKDLEFLRHASRESDLVAVGVQEIENLKPRRNEGGRTKEWRRLLIRTLGKDFVRVGHHAMGAVQLTLFARRDVVKRVKVVKLTEVVCGVGNVLQNKGGIGAYLRVDRTTFLFVAAHLAAHQAIEDRNSGYWRIVTTLDQEIPPAWPVPMPWLPGVRGPLPPRGPFGDRVDRVFFFGDLNYRVDLSREDLELGGGVEEIMASRRRAKGAGSFVGSVVMAGKTFLPCASYPGTGALDSLLDFDQLSLARSKGAAFGGFSEARVTFYPTYKYDKGSQHFDTSRKMRPPAWTDRILFSPPGPLGVSSLAYTSVPGSCHSDHRPVYAKFRVRLAD
ncbi:unnamed protein product [Scytosiphon promiscuus]